MAASYALTAPNAEPTLRWRRRNAIWSATIWSSNGGCRPHDALARSGRSGKKLLDASRTVTAFVSGFAQGELASPLAGDGDRSDQVIQRILDQPSAQYPYLTEMAGAASTSDPESEFLAGIRTLVRGLS